MVRVIAAVMLAALAAPSGQAPPATPGAWRPLFDGKTTAGWRGFKKAQMPEGWTVVDGALTRGGKAGDLVSIEQFDDFELKVEWKALVAKSKFKDHPGYARARRGHIGIQDHGDWAAFRSIQIRELGWEPLFNGKDLGGWKNYGEEKWTVENGEILGVAVTKAYGYLGTEKTYKDFEMRGKFKAEGTGNSGIFYHASITGTSINGVQVEVDPRSGRHTGGLYESGGRQWLVWPNSAAEQAMKVGDWNEVRFSVRGNHIMTWVNGVLALDYTDPAPKFTDGIIALQLHSGGEGRMRFKDLYVRELK